MAYPDPRLQELLAERFVAARVNTDDRPDLARAFGVFWSPTLVTLHHLGLHLRETIGYLPPGELVPELTLALGLHALRSARAREAEQTLRQVEVDFPRSTAAPEAAYWRGVAAYRRTRDKDDLWTVWRQLVRDYPASLWAAKTTLLPNDVA